MSNILFISHRFPYPPDRGEKIRAWHLLRHIARSHRVYLGCLIDDPRDWEHVNTIKDHCVDVGVFQIDKHWQKVNALLSYRPGRPLMLNYYCNRAMHNWVRKILAKTNIDLAYVYSTAMAPYVLNCSNLVKILDMVDVDSEKWRSYAQRSRWPANFIWRREARTLLAYERRAASLCECTLLVTQAEVDRLVSLAPELIGHVGCLENGVDLETFVPDLALANPYPSPGPWLSFVGNMDYWPNADAALWFASEVLPLVRAQFPTASFAVVGANPPSEVRSLANLPGLLVTGRVPDVRPYVAAANVSVAPLRIARGVQNKVLEAMALGRPVVATSAACEGIRVSPNQHLLIADEPKIMSDTIRAVLSNRYPDLGATARRCIEERYGWPAVLAQLDVILSKAGEVPHSMSSTES